MLKCNVLEANAISYSDTEYGDNDVHCLVLPSNSTTAISGVVPVAVGSSVQSRSVLLHNNSCYDVLERFPEFCELCEALLHDGRCPLINSVVYVVVLTNHPVYGLFYDLGNLVSYERALFGLLVIIHGIFCKIKANK